MISLQLRCLQEKRCVSMPSVSLSSSSDSSHRSRLLRLQDRRFRHKFPKVPLDEKLLNYFSCALVSDILLQGHLFITKNHFAFYSNIFGHKTEILISVADVIKVTKEKTAKIIPNAVGVYTEKEKYVFGSMLSRDSAYRVIQQTWIQSTDAGLGLPDDSESEASPALMLLADEDSSVSSGISGNQISDDTSSHAITPEHIATSVRLPTTSAILPPQPIPQTTKLIKHHSTSKCSFDFAKGYISSLDEIITTLSQLSRTSLLFVMSTILLVLLFVSTTILLYRIHLVHQKLVGNREIYSNNSPRLIPTMEFYGSEFAMLVKNLEEKIHSLAEIRKTLEDLLILANRFQQVPRPPINQCIT